jgi:hypothetical protein
VSARDVLMPDYWRMERFLMRHPPVDLLVASYLGYKPPRNIEGRPDLRHVSRANSEAMRGVPLRVSPTPKNLTPEMQKIIDDMKQRMAS